jgi:hypothetical protein
MIGHLLDWFVPSVLGRLFPDRYRVIPRKEDGAWMLRQFKITSWCYLQSFLIPEARGSYHLHRWHFMRSFVLSGSFREERFPGGPGDMTITHRAPSTYTMDSTTIHRLDRVAPRTWTLFLAFGDRAIPAGLRVKSL